jgi:hypothetical protein
MRTLVQVVFAFVIAALLLVALIVALPIQAIKMVAGRDAEANEDARRKAESVRN